MVASLRFSRPWPLLSVMLVGTVLGGCEMFNSGGRIRGDVGSGDPRPLPAEAIVVAEGNEELSYRAEVDGTVYFYDERQQRVVHAQNLKAGERFTVNPRLDLATVDGRPVMERDLTPMQPHRLYFNAAARDRP